MRTNSIAQKIERIIGEYFEACCIQDVQAIAECFAPGAVHYLPHLPPLRG